MGIEAESFIPSDFPFSILPLAIFHLSLPELRGPSAGKDKGKIEAICMLYREFQSAPPLSKHVECLWLLESSDQQESATPERILPDGCVELILNFGALFREHKEAGGCELQPSRFVVGQM